MRVGIRLPAERALGVRSLLEQQPQPGLSLRRLQRCPGQLVLPLRSQLGLDRRLTDRHAVPLDRVSLATHQRRDRLERLLCRPAELCGEIGAEPHQLLRLAGVVVQALVLQPGAEDGREPQILGAGHADVAGGRLGRLGDLVVALGEDRGRGADLLLGVAGGVERRPDPAGCGDPDRGDTGADRRPRPTRTLSLALRRRRNRTDLPASVRRRPA